MSTFDGGPRADGPERPCEEIMFGVKRGRSSNWTLDVRSLVSLPKAGGPLTMTLHLNFHQCDSEKRVAELVTVKKRVTVHVEPTRDGCFWTTMPVQSAPSTE